MTIKLLLLDCLPVIRDMFDGVRSTEKRLNMTMNGRVIKSEVKTRKDVSKKTYIVILTIIM